MVGPSGDDMIVSYNDTVLRRSDLDILSGPHYLNDRIIEFYFSYLSSSSSYPTEDIHLIPPSIAFWLQNCSDKETLKTFIEPLNFPAKKLVFFPVNNNDDVTQAEAGTHWSLLVFYRADNVFVHHDSFRGSNSVYSRMLYSNVAEFVSRTDSDVQYIEHKSSPQQDNGYDCGLFVVSVARAICDWYAGSDRVDDDRLWFSRVEEQVTQSTVSELRKQILGLVTGLMSDRCVE